MKLALALLACGACGGAKPAPVANATAPIAPGIVDGKLAAGPRPAVGCFAWSPSQYAAACIIDGEDAPQLGFVDGHSEAIVLEPVLTEAFVTTANERLAQDGFAALTVAAQPLALGHTFAVGTAKLSFTSRPFTGVTSSKATISQTTFQVRAHCPHDEPNVIAVSLEDGAHATVAVRPLGDHAIVEFTTHTTVDGVVTESFGAVVFDAKQCATRSAIPPS